MVGRRFGCGESGKEIGKTFTINSVFKIEERMRYTHFVTGHFIKFSQVECFSGFKPVDSSGRVRKMGCEKDDRNNQSVSELEIKLDRNK